MKCSIDMNDITRRIEKFRKFEGLQLVKDDLSMMLYIY